MYSRISALFFVVLVSGCVLIPGTGDTDRTGMDIPVEERSVQIVDFSPTSQVLRPDQETVVQLRLRNMHISDEVGIDEMEVYNTHPLELEEFSMAEDCSPSELRPAVGGTPFEMDCSFVLSAPSAEEMESFESRSANPRMRIVLDSQVSNSHEPFPVEFRPQQEIEDAGLVTRSYSNGEVQITVQTDQPVPSGIESRMNFDIINVGGGHLTEGYDFSVSPDDIFMEDCREELEFEDPIHDHAEFACSFENDVDRMLTENFVFATSYKYVLSPEVSIQVENYG